MAHQYERFAESARGQLRLEPPLAPSKRIGRWLAMRYGGVAKEALLTIKRLTELVQGGG